MTPEPGNQVPLFGVPHRPEWLALHDEPVLEPDLPVVDAHHHLWEFAWERYLFDELKSDVGSGHNIRATIHVQCGSHYRHESGPLFAPVGETEFASQVALSALARGEPTRYCAGIVGYADLRMPGVGEVLEAHSRTDPLRFKGIRQAAAWDMDQRLVNAHMGTVQGLYGDPQFRRGFASLAPMGLSFDVWALHPQLDEVLDLALAFPDTRIIVDHIGAPVGEGRFAGRHDEVYPVWLKGVRDLAECPNVAIKIGGLGLPILGMGFASAPRPFSSEELCRQMRRWVEPCIEAFGPGRSMLESNFPVDRHSFSYKVCWNAFKRLCNGCSESEKARLFHDTACEWYRLGL